MTPEDVVNQALEIAGSKNRIGSFYDGTPEAILALDLWAQTRDALLEKEAPDWATAHKTLTLSKAAPNIINYTALYDPPTWDPSAPEAPWLYEYFYPDDCINALQIRPQPFLLPRWRPRAEPFRLNINAEGVTGILCNVPNAILTYIRRVLDPTLWRDQFVMKVKIELARQFEPVVAPHRMERADANPPR